MDKRLAILKGLASVAWADGVVARVESAAISYLASVFQLTADEEKRLGEFLEAPVPLGDLGDLLPEHDDRLYLYRKAVLLSHVDGEQTPEEREMLAQLAELFALDETDVQAADLEAKAYRQPRPGDGG